MEFNEILSFADQLVYAKTGEHLNDLQRNILLGSLQGQKYTTIAEEQGLSANYVRDMGAKLLQVLSNALGEDVKKRNVRATFERLGSSSISHIGSHIGTDIVHIGNINICRNGSKPLETPKTRSHSTPILDLDDAPQPTIFYGRTTELTTLQNSILEKNSKLIAIAGLTGIGKTALTVQLIPQIQDHFHYIIWRNLRYFPTVESLQEELIEFFSQDEESHAEAQQPKEERRVNLKLRSLIKLLQSHRCLVILDDVQTLFSPGKLAGNYQPEYEEYGAFFKQLGEINHNSCFILNTWEVPKEITILAEENPKVKILPLKGLTEAAQDILRETGLEDQNLWDDLIKTYRGHPLWLKLVRTMIHKLCRGKISQCWQAEKPLLPEDLKAILYQQIDRLTPLEKQILTHLSQPDQPLTLAEIIPHFNASPNDTFNAIQSLQERFLIETIESRENRFTVSPILREYVSQCRVG